MKSPNRAALTAKADLARARAARWRRIRLADQDQAERTRPLGRTGGDVRPTRETEARVQADPLERLHAYETIDDAQRDAGLEIRAVYMALTASALARSGFPSGDRQPGRSGGLAEWAAIKHADHWLPWAKSLEARKPMLEVTIDVVVDGRSCSQVDRERAWANGKALRIVKETLRLYAGYMGGKLQGEAIDAKRQRYAELKTRRPAG